MLYFTYFTCVLLMITHLITAKNAKPNILLFLTDDQDLLLDGMKPMKNAINLIANEGITFENAFVNSPICCPSRSTLITGRYPHNTNVWNNSLSGNCANFKWRNQFESHSIGALLKSNAGYRTFYAGKYLNQYGKENIEERYSVPVGWDSWFGLIGNSKYYNYSLSENGKRVKYKNDYLTDVIKNKAVEFIRKNKNKNNPLFMVLAPPAPHAPATAASRHQSRFPNVKAIRSPSFNMTSLGKHWLIRQQPSHLPVDSSHLDLLQRSRLRSLLSVDEMILNVLGEFSKEQLQNSFVIYTSDNGYHVGQFSMPWDKRLPYETDVRVPLLISGPGLPKRLVSSLVIQTVDLAPTMLQMAGLQLPDYMDGHPLLNKMINEQPLQRVDILLEYRGEGSALTNDPSCPGSLDNNLAECSQESWCKCQDSRNNSYNCVRRLSSKEDFLFCHFLDEEHFIEAFDLIIDKYQINNIYSKMKQEEINDYNNVINKLIKCQGKECRI